MALRKRKTTPEVTQIDRIEKKEKRKLPVKALKALKALTHDVMRRVGFQRNVVTESLLYNFQGGPLAPVGTSPFQHLALSSHRNFKQQNKKTNRYLARMPGTVAR